jgi:cyclopropane-fatty-acyl-phospholipid synthase
MGLGWYGSVLRRVNKRGTLIVVSQDGSRETFGDGTAPRVVVRLHGFTTATKIALNPVLKLGEAYMDGTLTLEEGTEVADLLKLACTNLEWSPDNPNFKLAQTQRRLGGVLGQINRLKKSRENVAHHYDISNDFYELFLDEDKQYSCAYFTDPAMSLEDAQIAKKAHIAKKLLLDQPGLSLLDIGSGWGGLGISMAKAGAASVHGVTLSQEQLALARDRAEAAGLADRVRFDLTDYRELTGTYDRIVSVGMFEHVGRPNYRTFFETAYRRLADDGVMLLHTIGRADGPGDTDPWIGKYIFPGGYAPALSELMPHIERAGFYVGDIEIWRLHYALTLKHWYERARANQAKIEAMFDAKFFRMWMFYLAAARMAFEHMGHVVFQIQLSKRVGRLPLTRDYLYPAKT